MCSAVERFVVAFGNARRSLVNRVMKMRILIVENDAVTALDLEGLLTEADYFVTGIAASAKEALEMAEQSPPDLVLLDIEIAGGLDGIELARRLREDFSLEHVYLTGHIEPAIYIRANHTGPLGYIVKPFQDAELLVGIAIALCRSGLHCPAAGHWGVPASFASFVTGGFFPSSQRARVGEGVCPMELRCSSHRVTAGRSDREPRGMSGTTARTGAAAPRKDLAAASASWRPE